MKDLIKARELVNELEFGTDEWEAAMDVVRALVEKQNNECPPAAWTDKEWQDMMSR